jgi:hypothetical protein
MSVTSVMRPLSVLCDLGFVRREVPFEEAHPERSKRGLYQVADPFISFWCRNVLPRQSLLVAGKAELVLTRFIEPDLPSYLGGVFEEVCRQYILHRGEVLLGAPVVRVGRSWGAGYEIDLVAELSDGTMVVGECKAWGGPVGRNVLDGLRQRAIHAPRGRGQRYLLCGLHGFNEAIVTQAAAGEVALLDGATIFSPAP